MYCYDAAHRHALYAKELQSDHDRWYLSRATRDAVVSAHSAPFLQVGSAAPTLLNRVTAPVYYYSSQWVPYHRRKVTSWYRP
ncbi:hypothetical protein BIW11_13963 [Tropilaelaps mercedesae]|uniref:Uncharacterized protein n=1 Tax=Tropilaelaps mercedesae TaxID=418985 RepID=A0A1V9X033_9ACAR|nr:hypothetical protein BIW11_13963 [Tropilaelaps mercedesae]